MRKPMIASALAALLTITPITAAPVAAADQGEIGRFLLGAGTLLIIGSALSARQNERTRTTKPNVIHRPTQKTFVQPPKIRTKPTNVVPAACLRHNKYDYGPKRFFGPRCLRRNMTHAARLPSQCLRRVWTKNGERQVYGARCLRRSGWVFG